MSAALGELALWALALWGCSRGGGGAKKKTWPKIDTSDLPPIPPMPGTPPPVSAPWAEPPPEVIPQSWPSALPPGLPRFPGPAWEYDHPPPPEVVSRAWQLLPRLAMGQSTVEMTGGRWIGYRKEPHPGGKKGVTAYRLRPGTQGTSV